jgi:hypothetical protein
MAWRTAVFDRARQHLASAKYALGGPREVRCQPGATSGPWPRPLSAGRLKSLASTVPVDLGVQAHFSLDTAGSYL